MVQKNTSPFIFIESTLNSEPNPRSIFEDPEKLAQVTERIAKEKYAQIRINLRKGTIRSILYIFATKVVIALLIEYPYEKYILDHINWTSIGINLASAPILMFLMAMTVSVPGDDNTERVKSRLENILFMAEDGLRQIEMRLPISQGQKKLTRVFTLIYSYLFIIFSVLLAYFLFEFLHFNLVSSGLFFMFVSLVLLFGFRLRWQAQELLIAKPQQSFLDHIISLISIPFINLGVWLSSNLSKINFLTFILDKMIDAPLKSGVTAAEEWTEFLKERQDEAVEVPG